MAWLTNPALAMAAVMGLAAVGIVIVGTVAAAKLRPKSAPAPECQRRHVEDCDRPHVAATSRPPLKPMPALQRVPRTHAVGPQMTAVRHAAAAETQPMDRVEVGA